MRKMEFVNVKKLKANCVFLDHSLIESVVNQKYHKQFSHDIKSYFV